MVITELDICTAANAAMRNLLSLHDLDSAHADRFRTRLFTLYTLACSVEPDARVTLDLMAAYAWSYGGVFDDEPAPYLERRISGAEPV